MTDATLFALWRTASLLRHPRLHGKFLRRMRRVPDVALPRDYTDRMLWRKLFDRNPLFVTFADKLATKDWVAARCPDLPMPATLWAGEITLFPAAGHGTLEGEMRALVLDCWDLRRSWFLRAGAAGRGGFAQRYAAALRRACDAGALAP
jgi:hypothetical protein